MEARSAQDVWEAALGELQIQVSKSNYRTWLENTIGLSYQDNQFVVGVPNTFIGEYLHKNQRSLIEKTLISLTHQNTRVLFQVNGRHHRQSGNYAGQEETATASSARPLIFNPKYTFDSFIVGNSNRLAHSAALEVTQNPGHSYNPLYICGGPGLGKTHLLHAIGHAASANRLQVLYVSAEQFTYEFINSIQQKRTEEFRGKYRSVDMLLIDDVHFLSGKEHTEECLVNTFNELHNAGRQLVVTSDCHPQSMSLSAERLRSRFEWGLIADIQPPDFETRLDILRAKTKQHEAHLADDVLEFIARQTQQNIRELEGNLNRVAAYAKLVRIAATPELAAKALKDIAINTRKTAPITPSVVIEEVANIFQLAPLDLKSRKRDKETALARQVAMYILRRKTSCSLAQIGKELGGRDHSTVVHAKEKIASAIEINPDLRRKIDDIEQKICNHPGIGKKS